MAKQMSLAAYFNPTGHHVASWRHPRAQKDANVSIQHYVEMAQAAERAKFDMLFLADGSAVREAHIDAISRSVQFVAHFEPITLLSALAMVTKHIGLTATVNTTYEEPYNLARKFASLDILSGGRAAWNLVTSSSKGDIGNFGRDRALNHQERYGRAREFVQVVRGLWDSWDDDAFVRDVEAGLYFHPESMHYLNHSGQHFKSRGPLNVPRPVQGYPVQVQAGASDEGRDLAAEFAEAIFSPHLNIPEAKAYYDDVKGRMQAKFNRDPEHLKILPGLSVVVAESDDKAAEDFELLQSLIHPIVGREILATMLGNMDLSPYPLDEPLPDPLPPTNGSKGHYDSILSMARRREPHHPPAWRTLRRRPRQELHSRQPEEDRRLHGGMVRQQGLRRLLRPAALYARPARRFLQHGRPRVAEARHLPQGIYRLDPAREHGHSTSGKPLQGAETGGRVRGKSLLA